MGTETPMRELDISDRWSGRPRRACAPAGACVGLLDRCHKSVDCIASPFRSLLGTLTSTEASNKSPGARPPGMTARPERAEAAQAEYRNLHPLFSTHRKMKAVNVTAAR